MSIITTTQAAGYRDGAPVGDKTYKVCNGTYYDGETPDAVIEVLETARLRGQRVRIFLGDRETGRDWQEEYFVTGTVNRSMGPVHLPLLIAKINDLGGPAISDACIVKIMQGHRVVYQHPKYHAPSYHTWQPHTRDGDPAQPKGLPVRVDAAWSNGDGTLGPWTNVANFATWKKAARWVQFMLGQRLNK